MCSWLLAVILVATASCASHKDAAAKPRQPDPSEVAPARLGPAPAKIMSVNTQYKFIVLDFTSLAMPPVGTELTVYRNGKRVGAVRVTEPARAQFATADVVEGELQIGDEAR